MSKKRDGDDNEDEEMWRRDLNTFTIHINKLREESSNLTPSKPIIFKVDDLLHGVNQKDYEPKIVSIGPIHHKKEQVKSMEQHKVRLLQELLAEREDLTLEKLIEEVRKVECDARRCYSSKSINLNNGDHFLLTMILDGCFIIQLMRYYSRTEKSADPIFESNKFIQIIHDLLLFENQLPFLVLTTLFNEIKTGNPKDNLRNLILFLVGDIVPWIDDSVAKPFSPPDHLLGLVYGCISTKIPPKPNGRQGENPSAKAEKTPVQNCTGCIRFPNLCQLGARDSPKKTPPVLDIHSASQLNKVADIHLRSSKDNTITFARKCLRPYLLLPPLKVSHETELLLRNLMAYEQLHLGDDPKHVIDYMFFMHCLAKSTKDIEMLRYRGIIKNYLGRDEEILNMIGRLGTHFIRSSDYTYSDVFESLDKFCRNRWNRLMAILRQNYFNSPWSVITFLAATALLAFSAMQVAYAVNSYRLSKAQGRLNG